MEDGVSRGEGDLGGGAWVGMRGEWGDGGGGVRGGAHHTSNLNTNNPPGGVCKTIADKEAD